MSAVSASLMWWQTAAVMSQAEAASEASRRQRAARLSEEHPEPEPEPEPEPLEQQDGVLVRETRFGTKLQSGVIVATGRLPGLLRPRAMC